jgi:hypothetical protein
LDAVVDEALYKNIFIHLQGEIRFICGWKNL